MKILTKTLGFASLFSLLLIFTFGTANAARLVVGDNYGDGLYRGSYYNTGYGHGYGHLYGVGYYPGYYGYYPRYYGHPYYDGYYRAGYYYGGYGARSCRNYVAYTGHACGSNYRCFWRYGNRYCRSVYSCAPRAVTRTRCYWSRW